jgi:uncharacterized protein (DUF362 family)
MLFLKRELVNDILANFDGGKNMGQKESFGGFLKALRLRGGCGLRRLAELIDMPASNLCDIEHGRRGMPRNYLEKTAKALGLHNSDGDREKFFELARRSDELAVDVEKIAQRDMMPELLRTIDSARLSDKDLADLIEGIQGKKGDGEINVGLSRTPFELDPSRPAVFWQAGSGPYDNTRKALANIDLSVARGKRVLLKPNAGRKAKAGSGVTTHPEVVAAAIDAFREAGAEVAVGESPITGVKTLEAFESTGITAVADKRKCRLIDMDVRKYVPVEVPNGVAIKSIKVCPEVLEYDIVVSIPVMKTHMHTGVTLSVKNMKGCLWRRSKVDFHMLGPIDGYTEKPLDIAIADMASVLRPHLSIIDGTVGMEGLGPSGGKAKVLGVVVVGVDAFAADSLACALMGISASSIAHLRMGAERGFGVIDIGSINIVEKNFREVGSKFDRPAAKLSIEFSGFNILDKQSCSACQSTLLMFLKKHGKDLRNSVSEEKDIDIAIGKGHKEVPEGTLCIGSCTAKHKKRGIFVSGCPPVSSEILKEYFAS